MADWAGWLCSGLFAALAVLQFLGGLYCWYSLCRKSVPALWSIDWIDVLFRLEKEFRICFCSDDFRHIQDEADITAGELFAIVCRKVQEAGRPVPFGSWQRIRLVLHEALRASPWRIRRESRLRADLRME